MSKEINSNVIRFPSNRRKKERIAIDEFLKIYGVLVDHKMTEVTLVDASLDGCGFRMPAIAKKQLGPNPSELFVRLYFSQDTFLAITFKVHNIRDHVEEGVHFVIVGCSVDKNSSSFDIYRKFIDFLIAYSENAQKDVGDNQVSYL